MKKTLLFSGIAFMFIATSCDKVEFPNIGTVETNADCDTVFSFAAAASNHRNVLVEDFTGHTCGNCPGAAYELEQLHDVYGDTLIIIAEHGNTGFNIPQTGSGKYETDWRIEEAEQIMSDFAIPSSLPRLMIQREEVSAGYYVFSAPQLSTAVPARMGQTSDFAIKIEGAMLTDRTVCAKVEVEMLNTLASGDYSVISCLVEDSIQDYQTVYPGNHPDYDTGAAADTYSNYWHRHVLRDMFGHFGVNEGGPALSGSIWGDQLEGTLTSGELIQFSISSTPMPSSWDEQHMYIVTFVYDENTKEVMQVVQSKIAY